MIKLDSYTLSDNLIEKMKFDIEITKKRGIEIGFNLCTKDTTNELQDEKHCVGEPCKLTTWKPGCESNGKQVGVYHTHPIVPKRAKGESYPSILDMEAAYLYGNMCIGGAGDNKITCIVRKDNIADQNTIKSIKAAADIYEKPLRHIPKITTKKGYDRFKAKYRDLEYTRSKLQKNLFNTIEII